MTTCASSRLPESEHVGATVDIAERRGWTLSQTVAVPRRRTDRISEMLVDLPWPARWAVRFGTGMVKIVRVFFALQAIGGAVRLVVGLATRDWAAAIGGCGQIVFAGVLLGLNSGGSEQVFEAKGPDGQYVIRTGKRRQWRDEHGWRRVGRFVWGGHVWRAAARRRDDDPFGHVAYWDDSETERGAIAAAHHLQATIGEGGEPRVARARTVP